MAFPWVVTSTWPRGVYGLCVNFMKEATEGSTESGFMEKSGIEPATTALQDIGFLPIAVCPLNMCIHNLKV